MKNKSKGLVVVERRAPWETFPDNTPSEVGIYETLYEDGDTVTVNLMYWNNAWYDPYEVNKGLGSSIPTSSFMGADIRTEDAIQIRAFVSYFRKLDVPNTLESLNLKIGHSGWE